MKTYKVVTTLQVESWVDAESESEAVDVAREGMEFLTDGTFILDEYVTEAEDEDE